ncbi:hypothetical protein [Protofrankia coriariae]|uniref:hypothetical protein n=1 Tax=Protofrankia coriariae TaxID=1562887 RepID=UPI0012F6274F|nr:hypothetical protein [Protofrankia coriariae]
MSCVSPLTDTPGALDGGRPEGGRDTVDADGAVDTDGVDGVDSDRADIGDGVDGADGVDAEMGDVGGAGRGPPPSCGPHGSTSGLVDGRDHEPAASPPASRGPVPPTTGLSAGGLPAVPPPAALGPAATSSVAVYLSTTAKPPGTPSDAGLLGPGERQDEDDR